MYPRLTHETRNNLEQVIEESKLRPSFIMSHSTKVIFVQFDYKKLLRFTLAHRAPINIFLTGVCDESAKSPPTRRSSVEPSVTAGDELARFE